VAVRSTSIKAAAPARGDKVLRSLRALTFAVAVACAGISPFAQGLVQPAALPLVGKYFVPVEPTILTVENYPRTAVMGHTEHFSVRITGTSGATLTYVLRYPDKRLVRAHVRADRHGYSSYAFTIGGYRMHAFRETALVGVLDAKGHVRAYKLFAIQEPSR
jgi:hypothetical protein